MLVRKTYGYKSGLNLYQLKGSDYFPKTYPIKSYKQLKRGLTMSKAKQMAYNQVFDVTRALIEDAFYSVQDDILKHFEVYRYCEPNEIDIDYDEITDKIVDSVIGEILKG